MTKPIELRITQEHFDLLHKHLFPGDHDEHGAVLAIGLAESARSTRLLVRDVFPALDGRDYVPGTRGYRALTAQFITEKSGYCAEQDLGYLAVHCHGGLDSVGFSVDDNTSHERGYPALLQITRGRPVGALVFAENAVAGDIWTPGTRRALDRLTSLGSRIRMMSSSPRAVPISGNPLYDRHARLFGDIGQQILGDLKVGIIGLGGGGSLMNEWLARLGVGHIVAVDFDRIALTNLPRVVGSTRWDAKAFMQESRFGPLRTLGRRLARYKVHIAERLARQAQPSIRYEAIIGNVLDEVTALALRDVDFLVLASDTLQSRLVFNALVEQYLIPGAQIGVKVPVDRGTRKVGNILVASRPVLPGAGAGCLVCHGLVPPGRLQDEATSEEDRRAQRYVDDDEVAEPSVITLNALSAAQAANDLMMMFTGLYDDQVQMNHYHNFPRERQLTTILPTADATCSWCSSAGHSHFARGDSVRLPCRQRPLK